MKYKKFIVVALVVAASAILPFLGSHTVSADPPTTKVKCNDGKTVTATRTGSVFTNADYKRACKGHGGYTAPPAEETTPADPVAGDGCGGVKTSIIKCDQDNSGGVENNGVWGILLIVLNIMTAGVGILGVAGIVYASILYTTAEDNASQVKQATDIITNVVIGLVAFALMYAGLNFLIPGGVFG